MRSLIRVVVLLPGFAGCESPAVAEAEKAGVVAIQPVLDGEEVMEFGDVFSDGRFGFRFWCQVEPAGEGSTIDDESIPNLGELRLLNVQLPTGYGLDDPRAVLSLDGRTFNAGDPEFAVQSAKIGYSGDKNAALAVNRLAFKAISNSVFRVQVGATSVEELGELGVVEFRFTGDLPIGFTHFAPSGFPDDEVLKRTREWVGDPSLPIEGVLTSNVGRSARGSFGEFSGDFSTLVFDGDTFEKWRDALHGRHNEVGAVQLPGDLEERGSLEFFILRSTDESRRWAVVDPRSRFIRFFEISDREP